ncbi:uncharacterized protein LOC122498594 [Leptopilina heterotoma]|uniref:uncharacterized protein LOC122498594 n=1 Tax=Leptopilina heterotoma TaxID=63436 RepID=UPI001CA7EAC7|nr:uncharacterized protein LOC122498594 [Leptopilina heterotoma]
MLAMVVRGVFLVGILSLYSVSLWKMIDGFFKDRFQNYLHEEFKKNPTMRADLNKYAALKANKRENDFINIENLPSAPSMSEREFDETHLSQSGSVDILTTAATFLENNNPKITEQNTLLTISVDDNNNAFQESHELQAKRNPNPMKTRTTTTTTTTTGNHEQSSERTKKNGEMNDGEHGSSLDSRRIESEKRRNKGEKTIRQKRGSLLQLESNKKESKKRKYVPITFSDDDFRTAKKSFHEDDFSEFENEDEMQNEREIGGILVSELPIKPRFDIGVHEIVNADEFCPLTLEDEATCGITSKWP